MTHNRYLFVTIGILLLAFALRMTNIHYSSFKTDELYTLATVEEAIYGDGFIDGMRARLTHMPLYFALELWYPHPISHLSLRWQSLLWSMLTIAMTMRLITVIYQAPGWSLLAGILLAIHVYFIDLSRFARMYTLGNFLLVTASYLFLSHVSKLYRLSYWVTALAYLTHVGTIVIIPAQGVKILRRIHDRQMGWMSSIRWGMAHLVMLLPAIIWAVAIFNQERDGLAWIVPITQDRILEVANIFLIGSVNNTSVSIGLALLISVISVGFVIAWQHSPHIEYWISLTLIPFVGLLVISPIRNLFHERYLGLTLFAWVVLIVLSLKAIHDRLQNRYGRFGQRLAFGSVGLCLLVFGRHTVEAVHGYISPDFVRDSTAYIIEHGEREDTVVADLNMEIMDYYLPDRRFWLRWDNWEYLYRLNEQGWLSDDRVWMLLDSTVEYINFLNQIGVEPVRTYTNEWSLYLVTTDDIPPPYQ